MGSVPQAFQSSRPFKRPSINYSSVNRLDDHIHTLPELVVFNSKHNRDHLFGIQARSTAPWDYFTHGDFKNAVVNCAKWIEENVPLNRETKAPVALFMESDFGLMIYEFALMSIGIPVESSRLIIISSTAI